MKTIGIRREDKNKWEKRVPLVPKDTADLIRNHGFRVIVQPSMDHRAFPDDEYIAAGADISEDLSKADIIVGVKEVPISVIIDKKAYLFFAHVIKGQAYNMPMLKALLEKKCTLMDYEKIENSDGKRLIFFGRYAGIAGMVESLSAYGKRLSLEGVANPFEKIRQPFHYASLAEAIDVIREVGREILRHGLPQSIHPFVCGITGYGNVSQGAQEIIDLLPIRSITADQLRKGLDHLPVSETGMYKVVFEEKDMFRPKNTTNPFVLKDYFAHPEKYAATFPEVAPMLSIMVNCIFWTQACPRLLTRDDIRRIYADSSPRLKVIGDISCDIEGSVEATVAATDLDNPCYVYDVRTDTTIPGVVGNGPAIMAIENLPCEIPIEASSGFSQVLAGLFPAMAKADLSKPLEETRLPDEIRRAVIALNGQLTSRYKYIEQFLAKHA